MGKEKEKKKKKKKLTKLSSIHGPSSVAEELAGTASAAGGWLVAKRLFKIRNRLTGGGYWG